MTNSIITPDFFFWTGLLLWACLPSPKLKPTRRKKKRRRKKFCARYSCAKEKEEERIRSAARCASLALALSRLSRSAPQQLSPAPQSLRASAALSCASVLLFDSITASQSRYTLGRARINP